MNKRYRIVFLLVLLMGLGFTILLLLKGKHYSVLDPKGFIGLRERKLMITATLMSMIVVLPVFIMTVFFAWNYRATNKNAVYKPDWDHNIAIETVWWTVPLILIVILGVMTWQSSYELNPYKPINSTVKPMTIQVVALDWKWLFIYPEQNIATVNYIQFPENTPIDFEITSDAPMNSFWIPQLGGQMYAMAGMRTHLHLIANSLGQFNGSSANISGKGFSGMKFLAVSTTRLDFDKWVQSIKQTPKVLNIDQYQVLAKPSQNIPPSYYGSTDNTIYNWVVMKYMMPNTKMPISKDQNNPTETDNMNHDNMQGMGM